jgi:hypothetical protein
MKNSVTVELIEDDKICVAKAPGFKMNYVEDAHLLLEGVIVLMRKAHATGQMPSHEFLQNAKEILDKGFSTASDEFLIGEPVGKK